MNKYLAFIFFVVIYLFSSCKHPCDDVNCGPHGTCNEGICECEPSYSGEFCDKKDLCFNVTCENGNCINGACECDDYYAGTNCEVKKYSYLLGIKYGSYGCLGGAPGQLSEYEGLSYKPEDARNFQFVLLNDTFTATLRPVEFIAFDTDTLQKTSSTNHYAEGNLNNGKVYITIYEYDTQSGGINSTCVFQEQ